MAQFFQTLPTCINFDKSLLIGTRASEPEEIKNARENKLEIVTPLDILENGVSSIAQKITSRCGTESNVYLSLDLDCIDPGIAPGVSVPAPGGLSSSGSDFFGKKSLSGFEPSRIRHCRAYPCF